MNDPQNITEIVEQGRTAWINSANRLMTNESDKEIATMQYHVLMDEIDNLAAERDKYREDAKNAAKELHTILRDVQPRIDRGSFSSINDLLMSVEDCANRALSSLNFSYPSK